MIDRIWQYDYDCSAMVAAQVFAERSLCSRKKVGAIIVDGETDVVYGYGFNYVVGPNGCSKCVRVGQSPGDWKNTGGCPAIHAEHVAIIEAARAGRSTQGKIMYCTYMPCLRCADLIYLAGIKKVVYLEGHAMKGEVMDYLAQHDIECLRLELGGMRDGT